MCLYVIKDKILCRLFKKRKFLHNEVNKVGEIKINIQKGSHPY